VARVANAVADQVREFKVASEERRRSVLAQIKGDSARQLRDWWNEKDVRIDEWVKQHLERRREVLPGDTAVWPKPKDLPALRSYYAYMLARIYLTVGENRRIDEGDYYDTQHFACAAYSALLLSEDARFRQTSEEVGQAKPKVVSLNELELMLS
jgi:hypothetical protein